MDRQSAIEWWESLPFNSSNDVSKTSLFKRYFIDGGKFTPAQSYIQLTGREIEWIWEEEKDTSGIYAYKIFNCPGYDGHTPDNLNHEVCKHCGSIHYYH